MSSVVWPDLEAQPAQRIGGARLRARPAAIAAAYAAVLGAYFLWQIQPTHLFAFSYSYDEGVYAHTAWAIQRGHRLFDEIFSSQPPLVPWLIAVAFTHTGPSAAAARLIVVTLSLTCLLGVSLIAARSIGWQAGLGAAALLALSQHFSAPARHINPEVPSLGFATLAVGCSAFYARGRGRIWLLAAAAAFTAATLAKLSALIVVVPLAILLFGAHRHNSSVRALARDVCLMAAPLLLAWGSILLLADPAHVFDQLVSYHSAANRPLPSAGRNLGRLSELVTGEPIPWVLAGVGVAMYWTRGRRLVVLACLAWLAAVLASLVVLSTLSEHHLAMPLVPVAVLGGLGLAGVIAASGRLIRARHLGRETLGTSLAGGALAAAVLLVAAHSISSHLRHSTTLGAAERSGREAAAALNELPDSERPVVTDDLMIALAAGRKVPPALVDTSGARIYAGYLTTRDLQQTIVAEQPLAILFWSGRLDRAPGFRSWVEQHYRHERSFGPRQDLYVQGGTT